MYHPQCGGKRSRTVKSVAWGRSEGGWETRGRSGTKSPYRSTRGGPAIRTKRARTDPAAATVRRPDRSARTADRAAARTENELPARPPDGSSGRPREIGALIVRAENTGRIASGLPKHRKKIVFATLFGKTKANTPSAKHAREKDEPSAGGCRPHGSAPSRRRTPRRAAGGGNGRLSLHFRSASSLNTGIGQHSPCSFLRNSRRIMRDTSRKASMRNDAARPT